jgi:hypothetical protein
LTAYLPADKYARYCGQVFRQLPAGWPLQAKLPIQVNRRHVSGRYRKFTRGVKSRGAVPFVIASRAAISVITMARLRAIG